MVTEPICQPSEFPPKRASGREGSAAFPKGGDIPDSGLVESGELAKITVKGTSKVIVGTPAEIERMLSEATAGMYRC